MDDVVLVEKAAEINRYGNPANPPALVGSTNGPRIGQVWDPFIDHSDFAPAGTIDLLGITPTLLNLPSPDGTIMVDPVNSLFLIQSPGAKFQIPIANDPSLIGVTLFAQGATIDFIFLPLTQAIEVTIQS